MCIIEPLEDYAKSCWAFPVSDINNKIRLANELLEKIKNIQKSSNEPNFLQLMNTFESRTTMILSIIMGVKTHKLIRGMS